MLVNRASDELSSEYKNSKPSWTNKCKMVKFVALSFV